MVKKPTNKWSKQWPNISYPHFPGQASTRNGEQTHGSGGGNDIGYSSTYWRMLIVQLNCQYPIKVICEMT